jgi:hypothetical protein
MSQRRCLCCRAIAVVATTRVAGPPPAVSGQVATTATFTYPRHPSRIPPSLLPCPVAPMPPTAVALATGARDWTTSAASSEAVTTPGVPWPLFGR